MYIYILYQSRSAVDVMIACVSFCLSVSTLSVSTFCAFTACVVIVYYREPIGVFAGVCNLTPRFQVKSLPVFDGAKIYMYRYMCTV